MAKTYAHTYETLDSTLTAEQMDRFHTDGVIAVRKLLSEDQVRAALAARVEIIDKLREELAGGAAVYTPPRDVNNNYAGARIDRPGSRTRMQYEPGYDPGTATAEDVELHVRNMYSYHRDHSFFEQLVQWEPIVGIVRQLMDDQPLLFQSMALNKAPRTGTEKPWHQDDAYFKYAPLEKIIGVWIALDDAAAGNGCMHVLPGWHKRGALRHVHTFDCHIIPDRIAGTEPQAVELPAGGAMFFSGLLPHQTPPNRSDLRRRALQFHYRGASTELLDTDAYSRTFAEADGTPASCAVAPRL